MRRGIQLVLAVLALIALQTANGQQALSLGSAFPGEDTGDASASATPSPPAATASPAAAGAAPAIAPTPTPGPAPAPGPTAGAPVKAPAATPAVAPAAAPTAGAKAPAPGPAAAGAGATAGTPAPVGAAIATGAGDIGAAPAPGPASGSGQQINIVYIQQAGNARLQPSATDPAAGTMFMNNALDTTLYDQDVPIRKLGKTSSQNFLNAPTGAAAANTTGPQSWFAPAPTAVLLGFNTSQNVYALLSLSAPIYNYTTNTVFFNYLLKTPTVAANTNATNGWLINFFTNSPESVSGAVAMLAVPAGGVTLFTPSLLTTIPCVSTQAVPKGSCTIYNAPDSTCSTGGHGQWINGTFCG